MSQAEQSGLPMFLKRALWTVGIGFATGLLLLALGTLLMAFGEPESDADPGLLYAIGHFLKRYCWVLAMIAAAAVNFIFAYCDARAHSRRQSTMQRP